MIVHVVGAGLSGLAAAVALASAGKPVRLYEGAGQAGGRCRSYHDKTLDRVIDNGNHLLLSGNRNALHYLAMLGAEDRLVGPAGEGFRFLDLDRGREFHLRPNPGPIAWWILSRARRVPDTSVLDYLAAFRLMFARETATVADTLPHDELYRLLWEPLAVSALNTPADEASARGFWAVLTRTLLRGGAAARPLIAKHDLGHTFVEPALDLLDRKGTERRMNARLKRIVHVHERVTALQFDDQEVAAA